MRKLMMPFTIVICTMLLISGVGKASAQKVLVNIWDGTERTVIEELFNEVGTLPNLKSLGRLFYLTSNQDDLSPCEYDNCRMRTDTKAQHATMLTGVLADEHGVYANGRYRIIPDGLTVYELLESSIPSIRTAHIAGKPENFGVKTFGNIIEDIDFFIVEEPKMSPKAGANHARRLIRKWWDQDFFIVCHFLHPDQKGHKKGVNSEQYRQAIIDADKQLGRILEKLDYYGIRGETKIYVLSDHGFGTPKPNNHGKAPNTFIVSTDPAMTHIDMVEVADFLLSNFGL